MVYTADEHPAIAVLDSPTGPFKKLTDNWLREKHAIDEHLLFDDDGSIYLCFAVLENGNQIRVAKISNDLKSIEWEHNDVLIKAEEPWETIRSLKCI